MAPKEDRKPELLPPSSFSEPSDPSEIIPEDKGEKKWTGEQGENPQLIAHTPGKQGADRNRAGKGKGKDKGGRSTLGPPAGQVGTAKAYDAIEKKGGYVGGKLNSKL
ncbi:unnamed protein product [Somion occarium]|uniref:Uncharacterized protein n=1 Tax=Somion occarium TaxID=3059160 RepID=A0ABP1EBA2_9APHY